MLKVCLSCASILLMLHLATAGLARTPQEQRGVCGDYTYALPQGFTTASVPQPYADSIYLWGKTEQTSEIRDRILCIQKENTGDKEYVLEEAQVLKPMPQLGGDWLLRLKRYEGELPQGVRVHEWVMRATKKMPMNWSSFIVEMNAKGDRQHTIFVFERSSLYRHIKKKGRVVDSVLISAEELKAHAMAFIASIRKER